MSSQQLNGFDEEVMNEALLGITRNQLSFQSNTTSQIALVGANIYPIQSLDFEIIENDFFKQDWRSREKAQIFQYIFMKWVLVFLIGLTVSLLGFFTNLAVENVAGMKFVITSNMMLHNKHQTAFFVFTGYNLGLTLFASLITALIAPAAAGSGIPEVKAYLNGVDVPEIFSLKTLIVKISGSIAAVSSSLLIGKAGPMVHSASSIAALLGQGGTKNYHLTWKWLHFFKNDRDRRDLVTCGTAAGIAAAFRAPVGGVLFAWEEMASWSRGALLWRSFFSNVIVAIMLRSFMDFCYKGNCGLFGTGGLIMFNVTSEDFVYHLSNVPVVLLIGIVGGCLAALYNSILAKVLKLYNRINEKGVVYQILLACSLSLFTSGLLFGLPWLATCQPCPEGSSEACPTIGRSGNFKKFQCPPSHYNDLASLIFNTNDDSIRNLFRHSTDSEFHGITLLIFFVTCFFLSIVSYGAVVPSGLFVPVIVTGASYGRYIGMLLRSHSNLNHGLFAVLGAASFLGGSMRMTVSLCVILLELTNNLLLLPLIMVALLVSKSVADCFNCNIYDIMMKLKGLPYLKAHAEPYMRQLTVADVVTGPLQYFRGIEKVKNIVDILKRSSHNGFPVLDEQEHSENPVLFGLILRANLIVLLKKKAFFFTPMRTDAEAFDQFSSVDFAKDGFGMDDIDDVELTSEEMEMFVDLHPFTNASPYTVVETMSLAKALILFRQVGLRHMLVIPKTPDRPPVVGMLTRHDFMAEHISNLYPSLVRRKWKRFTLPLHPLSKFF
ncbi:hypothetical protein RND81_07G111700 [Saponaria officinalis]|uniref:Chloride channel protein n=1 Tax=Saponaria officinalis TaxID=3572 RepID=A0AAW1JQV9_SAPOF